MIGRKTIHIQAKLRVFCLCAAVFCALVLLPREAAFAAIGAQASVFDGGDGSEESPYLISTAAQLDAVRDHAGIFDEWGIPYLGHYFRLTADIDLGAYLSEGGAGHAKWGEKGWEPIKIGASTFDGGGHTIRGLYIDRPDERRVGLFGIAADSYIEDTVVELSDRGVTGLSYAGGIVGEITSIDMVKDGAAVRRCSVRGRVSAVVEADAFLPCAYAGLIAGSLLVAEAEGCYGQGSVTGVSGVGGIAGGAQYAGIADCLYLGSVIATAPPSWKTTSAAGIAGAAIDTVFANCLFVANGDSHRTAAIAGFNGKPRSDGEAIALTPSKLQGCYYNADGFSGPLHSLKANTTSSPIVENSRGLTQKELRDKNSFVGFDFQTVWGFTKAGEPVLRAFGGAYDPPDLTWLWIALGCVAFEGGLIALGIVLYRRKKKIVVHTVEVEREVIREIPKPAIPLPDELSARERRVAELILKGMSRREIADVLGVSDGAVGTYATRIYTKTGMGGQKEFIAYYLGGELKE